MSNTRYINEAFLENQQVSQKTVEKLRDQINRASDLMIEAISSGRCIFWCGNGGSAADSSHLAAELIGRFNHKRRAIRSISLNADTSALTCIANDFGYEFVFSRQIEGLGKSGDILIIISTSGQSPNLFKAINKARELNLTTIGLLGRDGGGIKALLDLSIVIPSYSTARIQEQHILIGHILCELVEKELL